MAATYGSKWRTPRSNYHGKSIVPRDEGKVKLALLEKLSVTAWGDMPWQERQKMCGLT